MVRHKVGTPTAGPLAYLTLWREGEDARMEVVNNYGDIG